MSNLEQEIKNTLGQPLKVLNGGEHLYKYSPCCNRYDDKMMVNWNKEQWICNHQNTCGQKGNLYQLAKMLNVNIPKQQMNIYQPQPKQEIKRYQLPKIETEPIQFESTDNVNLIDRMRQLHALFNEDDVLFICQDAKYFEIESMKQALLQYEENNYTHFKVNHGGTKIDDIKDLRYTLVECDELADLNRQKQILLGLNLPIASLTYSGNKSLHAVIKVEADTPQEYKRRVDVIHNVCKSVNFKIDNTRDACRFTRMAGAINPATGKYQQLLDINIGAKSWDDWEVFELPKLEVTEHTLNTGQIESKPIEAGFSSGFLTHDYNDSGLKAGGLTLLTGRRNQGKTTFARQIMIATAMQGINVYAYMGEGEVEREKGYLERLIAQKGELLPYDNGYGRTDYMANDKVKERFNTYVAPFIDFYNKPLKMNRTVFDSIINEMTIKARQGAKLFVIDNMMKLTADQREVFKAQQMIICKLKEFAVHFRTHIILIAHPKKDGTSVSGAMEQENTADTILNFQRLFQSLNESEVKEHISQRDLDKVTALVTNEKVRDGGTSHTMYMQFDPVKQANIDIVYLPSLFNTAAEYCENGYYSREMI